MPGVQTFGLGRDGEDDRSGAKMRGEKRTILTYCARTEQVKKPEPPRECQRLEKIWACEQGSRQGNSSI